MCINHRAFSVMAMFVLSLFSCGCSDLSVPNPFQKKVTELQLDSLDNFFDMLLKQEFLLAHQLLDESYALSISVDELSDIWLTPINIYGDFGEITKKHYDLDPIYKNGTAIFVLGCTFGDEGNGAFYFEVLPNGKISKISSKITEL